MILPAKSKFLTLFIVFALTATYSIAQETVYFSKDSTTRKELKKKKKTTPKNRSTETNIIKVAPVGFLFWNDTRFV
jgi:hypothetical protein